MCGIIGISSQSLPVNQDLYDGLTVLQHRGQDAAGIMTSSQGRIALRKGKGLVRDCIRTEHMMRLKGLMGIGHVRYPTAGGDSVAEANPFFVNSPFGLGLVHNGNLVNVAALRKELVQERRHLNTNSDSEVLLNVFAKALHDEVREVQMLAPEHVFNAVRSVHERCVGSYAVVVMIVGYGLVSFRDPLGIRPLCWGTRGKDVVFSSESVAINALGFEYEGDVAPGEALYVTKEGAQYRKQCAERPIHAPCLFEYVYLARPDSIIDGVSVYQARLNMGENFAETILAEWPDHDIDVVIPIPDTSRSGALPLAQKLKVPYREGFVKNRYIGRTFIMPGQVLREKSVQQKLNAMSAEFKGKNVLLVDDSIVRGTTSKEVIQMARDAGANKVYFASVAPEVMFPNVYGIDMPAAKELLAHGRSIEEMCESIGADRLIFQKLSDLYKAIQDCNPTLTQCEDSVFTGQYKTGGVDARYLNALAMARHNTARTA